MSPFGLRDRLYLISSLRFQDNIKGNHAEPETAASEILLLRLHIYVDIDNYANNLVYCADCTFGAGRFV